MVNMGDDAKISYFIHTEEKKKLEKRIKELEKALEYSNLRADAYNKMIDVAEEVLNISIRKKSGTKQ